MAAGLKTLELVSAPGFYENLNTKVHTLVNGIVAQAKAAGIAMTSNVVGGMFGLFLTDAEKVSSFQQVTQCDIDGFKNFFHGMLDEGVYMAPSAYEAGFVSSMHTDDDIQASIKAAAKVLGKLK